MTAILVVDDHPLMRAGLSCLLGEADGLTVAGTAGDGVQALRLLDTVRCDVVLMDLSMPALDGVEATRRVHDRHPGIAVVVLTSFCDRVHVRDAFDAGAAGYLLKDMAPELLVASLQGISAGRAPVDPRVSRVLARMHGQHLRVPSQVGR